MYTVPIAVRYLNTNVQIQVNILNSDHFHTFKDHTSTMYRVPNPERNKIKYDAMPDKDIHVISQIIDIFVKTGELYLLYLFYAKILNI